MLLFNPRRIMKGNANQVLLIVEIGQSNMETCEASGTTPSGIYTAPQTGFKIYTNGAKIAYPAVPAYTPNLGSFDTLEWGVNNTWRTVAGTGPELGIAYHLKNDWGINEAYFVKYALGAAAMVDNGTVSNVGLWQKNPVIANCDGYDHLRILLYHFLIPAIFLLRSQGKEPYVVLVGAQGEADSVIQFRAENWETKAIEMVQHIKDVLKPFNVGAERMHVIWMQLHNKFNAGTRPYITTVRTGIQNLCDHFNGTCVTNVNSYAVNADNIHYTWQAACDQYGKTVAGTIAQRLI